MNVPIATLIIVSIDNALMGIEKVLLISTKDLPGASAITGLMEATTSLKGGPEAYL